MTDDDPDAPFSMRRGAIASAVLHGGLVAFALFGGKIFDSNEAQAIQFAEVDLISGAEFDAALSVAPDAPREALKALQTPQFAEDETVDATSDASPGASSTDDLETPPEQENAPDLTKLASLAPQGAVMLTAPKAPVETVEDSAPRGAAPMAAPVPVGPERLDAPMRPDRQAVIDTSPPKAADRVAPEAAPETELLTEADEAVREVTPSDDAAEVEVAEETTPAAPPEATTEIVTEADEAGDEPSRAPIATVPPKGRPASVVAQAEEVEEAPKEAETAAADVEKPAETAGERKPRRAAEAPLGQRLTQGEIEGVRLGLVKFWRIDRVTNQPNFEELIVTMRVRLDQSGQIIGEPELVSPATITDGRFRIAVDAARIALLRKKKFELPPEKYGRWKTIEVTFNPKNEGVYF